MGLSNYQLVLLDNLIYLDEVTRVISKQDTIGDVVNNLLYAEGNPANDAGTGTITTDWNNHYIPDDPEAKNCMMSKEEWIEVLKAIEADKTLCSLTIHEVEDHREGDTDGFRAMALTGDAVDENIIIFKGTSSAEEWLEDAEGGYSIVTAGQQLALDFVNGIDIINNKSFVVSGHSKGGNMAQYAALFATNPPIDRCLSYDGQGFSNELCETQAYKEAIERNGQNLYLIASSGDYVNVLFNSPIPDDHKMYLAANNSMLYYIEYHKPNTVLKIEEVDGSIMATGLNDMSTMNVVSVFAQDFVAYIMETETDVEKKKIVFDGIMGILAADAESDDDIEIGETKEIILALCVMPVAAGYSGMLDGFGIDSKNLWGTKIEDYTNMLGLTEAGQYQGVVFQAINEGALNLMLDYLGQYIAESTSNLYSVLALIDNVVSGDAFENLGDIGKLIINTYWKGTVNLFDAKTGCSIEKYWNNVFNSFAVTSTLGEETKGNVYTEQLEDGGMLYIGSGESEKGINGTTGNDILYGGNGADTINGGAGNDVLWGGRGNDVLNGGSGADRYVFGLYDGDDIIFNDNSGNYKDYIFFDEDVKASDVSFGMSGLDLVIHVGTDSSVTVKNFFAISGDGRYTNAIDTIEFMNGGSKLEFAEICRLAGYEGTDSTQKKNEDSSLSEEEKDALEEEKRQLKKWYEEYYEEKEKQNGTHSDAGGTGSGENLQDLESPDEDDSEETAGDSDENTNANEDDNSQNSVNRAKNKIMWRDPGSFHNSTTRTQSDPVIVDLNGDGVYTTSLEDGTYFDLNKDGFAEKTAWITEQDGLLVRDINGNGAIDDGGELFGDRTVLSGGSVAGTGFEALSDLDDNKDGMLDTQDLKYHELKIWMDANHNGISEAGELYSLDDFGITSIDLDYNRVNRTDENGNLMKAGSNIYGRDADYSIGEYDFRVDFSDTQYRGEGIETENLERCLPEIKGCGTLLDLSKAMASNDDLKAMVLLYITETDYLVKKDILKNVLFLWADVAEVEAGSRGRLIDARKLGVVERVYGQPFVGVSGENPNNAAAEILNRLYNEFEQEAEECLLSQSVYQEALSGIKVYHNADTQGSYCDFFSAIKTLTTDYSLCYIPMFVDYVLKNTDLGDLFDKQYIYEQLKSENEAWAEAMNAESILYRADNGTIRGGSRNDILLSGTENDLLLGGKGNDTYLFNKGHGQDILTEGEGTDTIVFGEGIREEDIRVSRDSYNLYLTNPENGDSITVKNFFNHANYQIERVEFADGSKWSLSDLLDKARYYYGGEEDDIIGAYNDDYGTSLEDDYIYGGAGNDTLRGNNGNDELYGESGNDTLYGGKGDDLLAGGEGKDVLYGGAGDDTYLFNIGDGQDSIIEENGMDTIVFGEGIREEDIRVSRDAKTLYLTNLESGDQVKIINFFVDSYCGIEQVEFADGSKWSLPDLLDKARYYYGGEEADTIGAYNDDCGISLEDDYIYGGAGNDTLRGNNGNDELYGESGNDTLYGGKGDDLLAGGEGKDVLYGGAGDDTYLFNIGDGQDSIIEESGTDTIVFGEGIREEDIRVSRDAKTLYLTNLESGDQVKIINFFVNSYCGIEQVEFADGSRWSLPDLLDKARYYYGGEEADTIGAYNDDCGTSLEDDYIYGGAGNDTLRGNNGNDELYGESGNDTLYGGRGDDLLAGGEGKDVLYGGAGDDTYLFNIGDGQDTIIDESGTDKIIFGEGIDTSDLMFSKAGNSLKISLMGQEDNITISNYFNNDNYKIESFQTSDGSMLDYTKLNVMIQAMASFEDTTGMMWEDAVEQKNEQANDLINQWWTKEAI